MGRWETQLSPTKIQRNLEKVRVLQYDNKNERKGKKKMRFEGGNWKEHNL